MKAGSGTDVTERVARQESKRDQAHDAARADAQADAQADAPADLRPSRTRNLPELIVATFLELMRTQNPNGIAFRDIAAAAGISHMAPYRHFKSKQALLNRIGDLGFGMLAAALEEAGARHPLAPRRQVVAACACYYRFAVDNPAYAQVMFGTDRELWDKAEPLPALDRTRAILQRIIHDCQLAGELPREIDVKKVLGLLWAHVHGFTLLAANRVLTEQEVGAPEAFLEEGVGIILAGLAAPAGGAAAQRASRKP